MKLACLLVALRTSLKISRNKTRCKYHNSVNITSVIILRYSVQQKMALCALHPHHCRIFSHYLFVNMNMISGTK